MTINEAILKVLTAQFKKDEPEAFEMVSNHGYKVSKWNGCWKVSNEATSRCLWGSENSWWNSRLHRYAPCLHLRCGGSTLYDRKVWSADKFDYVGFLNKPINQYAIDEKYKSWQEREWSEARRTYERLKDYKLNIKFYEKSLESELDIFNRKMKEISDSYQRNVKYYTNALNGARENLKELYKEAGLKK